MNWLFRFLYDWILYVKDAIFVADSGSAKDGLKGTGDGAGSGVNGVGSSAGSPGVSGTGTVNNPGGKFTGNGTGPGGDLTGGASGPAALLTAGGGGAPVRGALAFTAQIAPSSPNLCDTYMDSAANVLRTVVQAGAMPAFAWLSKLLHFSGIPGNTASTTYFLAATAASNAAAPTTSAMGTTKHVVPVGRAVQFGIKTSATTVGGAITVQLFMNGSQVGASVSIPAGSGAAVFGSAVLNVLVGSISEVELRVVNGVGVTTGLGQCVGWVEVV
jgi:hypothetical protein